MLQNMLMTALTPLSATNEFDCWDNRPFVNQWPEFHINGNKKCETITRTIKKKPKRSRTAFTTEQINCLEREFSRHAYIDAKQRAALSKSINIGEQQLKVWFQNRRMKQKRQFSESNSDCDASSTSSVMTSTNNEEDSLIAKPLNVGTNRNHQEPMYNIEVTHQVEDDQNEYHPQLFPTYENIRYREERGIYPTEYYPPSYEVNNNSYGFFETRLDQNYNSQATGWSDYDVNLYSNDEYTWQQNV